MLLRLFPNEISPVRPTDLTFNQIFGMRDAPPGAAHLLELPWDDRWKNHVGTSHAAVQFALAETAAAECLRRTFPDLAGQVLAVVRRVDVRYRQAGTGDLFAFGHLSNESAEQLRSELSSRGKTFFPVTTELRDAQGATTLVGTFTWYISRERTK